MKDKEAIERKLEEVQYQYFTREYGDKLSCRPKNCVHNYRHEEDGEEVGLCMLGAENYEEWPGNVCDEKETAQKCPFFELKHDQDSLKREFAEKMDDKSLLAREYKDIVALKWVLEDDEDLEFGLMRKVYLFYLRFVLLIRNWFRI